MASAKGRIIRLLSGVMLKRATIVTSQEIGRFQRLLVRCDVQEFSPGTKVQLLLPTDDMRTYTPVSSPDGIVLLGWKGADGPGARWMSTARPRDELLFVGPQRSLELDAGPAVLIGDETSVAVAAAFASEKRGQFHAIIETDAAADVYAAASSVGLHHLDVVSRGDTVSIVTAVVDKLSAFPDACIALTGGSELVVGAREALRRAGVRNIKTKTYWIPGRTGLD